MIQKGTCMKRTTASSESTGRHDKKSMLTYVRARGYTTTDAQLDDWIGKGLVGSPHIMYPGRGSKTTWSDQQRELFLALLIQNKQYGNQRNRIGELCNVPVSRWLYLGNMSDVSLEQVKCAMTTWGSMHTTSSKEAARKGAVTLVHQLGDPKAGGKRKLINKLKRTVYERKRYEQKDLESLLTDIIHYQMQGKAPTSSLLSPESVSRLIWTRYRLMEDIRSISKSHWDWARICLLATTIWYRDVEPTASPYYELATLLIRDTVEDKCQFACPDLCTILAIAEVDALAIALPAYLRPKAWEAGRVVSTLKTEMVPLFSPDGTHSINLCTQVAISLR